MVCDVEHAELPWVVEESDVDASSVGRVMMADLEHPGANRGVFDKVFENGTVFDFGDSDNRGSVRCGFGGHLRDCIGKIVDLCPVFPASPKVLAVGGVFEVTSEGVVGDGIEKVFEVIESDSVDSDFAGVLGKGGEGKQRDRGQ